MKPYVSKFSGLKKGNLKPGQAKVLLDFFGSYGNSFADNHPEQEKAFLDAVRALEDIYYDSKKA